LNKSQSIPVKKIAELVGGKIVGNTNDVIYSVSRIDEAKKGDLTFLYLSAFEKFADTTSATAILIKPDFKKTRNDITYIEVAEPEKAFAAVLINFFPTQYTLEGIDKTASVHPSTTLGKNISLGKNVVIGADCKIGNNVKVYHNTVILENVEIGDDVIIYQNISIREGCKIGNRVIIHAGTVIGADGFGYQKDEKGVYQKLPQLGNVVIEDDVEIGANTAIDRAALGSTIIRRGVKIDNLVQVAHNVDIGENTVISGQSGIAGSIKIGKNCILAGQVGLAGHLDLGDNVILLAQSGVTKSLLKPGIYFGYPAKDAKTARILEAHTRNLPEYSERIKKLEEEIKKLKEEIAHQKA